VYKIVFTCTEPNTWLRTNFFLEAYSMGSNFQNEMDYHGFPQLNDDSDYRNLSPVNGWHEMSSNTMQPTDCVNAFEMLPQVDYSKQINTNFHQESLFHMNRLKQVVFEQLNKTSYLENSCNELTSTLKGIKEVYKKEKKLVIFYVKGSLFIFIL